MVSIRERPAEAEDRAVPGHWEGDLVTGANDTHIATLVERSTRFVMLVKLPRKDTTNVVTALAKHIRKLPKELRRSLTWDQGKEMHAHKRFTLATNVQVYFCDPRSLHPHSCSCDPEILRAGKGYGASSCLTGRRRRLPNGFEQQIQHITDAWRCCHSLFARF